MNKCLTPPQGWECTRESGHEGPCAAIAVAYGDTPETDTQDWITCEGSLGQTEVGVDIEFARNLERQRDLAERRLKLSGFYGDSGKYILEMEAQIVALREALKGVNIWLESCIKCEKWFWDVDQQQAAQGSLDFANETLSAPPPAVVPLEDVRLLINALETCARPPKAAMYPDGPYLDKEDYKEVHEALSTFAAKHPL